MDEEKCCDLISKKDWDKKTIKWKNKLFVKKHYLAFFYMPLGLDKALGNLMEDLNKKDNLARKLRSWSGGMRECSAVMSMSQSRKKILTMIMRQSQEHSKPAIMKENPIQKQDPGSRNSRLM